MDKREILLYLSLKFGGDWSAITEAILTKMPLDLKEAEEIVRKTKVDYLTITDEDYPDCFRTICRPPIVLFYKGNLELMKDWNRNVTIVGSRDALPSSTKRVREISEELSKQGYCVVSGLARGIDTAAALGAVDQGRAIAVIGTGLDVYYPSENESLQRKVASKGLLLSEYPPGTRPAHDHFPSRNRLLAALSPLTFIGEAKAKSGTLITVMLALESGRDVACLPFRAEDETANNALIRDGAFLAETAEDLISLLPNSGKRYQKTEA